MTRSDLALAALATAAVPGMRPVQVAGIRTGEESPLHQSALVEDVTGRTWLVRAPLGAAAGAELERNDDLIRQLGKHLPFKVPAAAGYADLGQDGRAGVYPYVEGQGLSLRHLPVGPGLTNAVGRALAAIHNMPRELFEEHAVPVFDAAEFRARKLTELDRAAETGHVPNGLLARWEQALDAEQMWEFATVPTHGSLDGASFLVVFSEDDAASGRVVGISGWERAQIADPAEDFARLVQQSHPHAVDEVFESYSMARAQRPDGYLLHRARLASEMRLLSGLVAAIGTDDQDFVRTRADQLRKLDRLTANDNSLVPRTVVAAGVSQQPEQSGATQSAREDTDDEPAFVVEQPTEGAHLEPAHATDADGSATGDKDTTNPLTDASPADASPADVTAPIPVLDTEAGPLDDVTDGGLAEDKVPTGDTDEHDSATAHHPAPEETAPSAVSHDKPAEDAAPESVEDAATEAEETGDDGTTVDGEAAPDRSALVVEDPADEAAQDEAAHDGSAEEDAAETADEDAAEQERLHTLYGMPDEDEVEPDRR